MSERFRDDLQIVFVLMGTLDLLVAILALSK